MSYPTFYLIHENYIYEYNETNITSENLENFILNDFVNYEKEDYIIIPQKWRNFKKSVAKILKRARNVIIDESAKGFLIIGCIVSFVVILFLVGSFAAKKLEEHKIKIKEHLNKKS